MEKWKKIKVSEIKENDLLSLAKLYMFWLWVNKYTIKQSDMRFWYLIEFNKNVIFVSMITLSTFFKNNIKNVK